MEKDEIICYCLNVTYQDLCDAVDAGASNMEELQMMTQAGTGCMSCLPLVEEIFIQLLNEKNMKKS